MVVKCSACQKEYSDDIWLHEELGICSICYSIHIHSEVKKWNGYHWVSKTHNCKTCEVGLEYCNNNFENCYYIKKKEKKESLEEWLR